MKEKIKLDPQSMLDQYWFIPSKHSKSNSGKKKLDLHGIKHVDVKPMLIGFIEGLWNSGTHVEIITGHSSEMKAIVFQVLKEYKVEYYDGGFLNTNPAIITCEI